MSRQTGIVLLREPHSVSGERVHQRELAAGAPEEEPVRHGAVADGVLRSGTGMRCISPPGMLQTERGQLEGAARR